MGAIVFFLILGSAGAVFFLACLIWGWADGARGKELLKWNTKCLAVVILPIYALQLIFLVPSTIEKGRIQSSTSDHFVTLELRKGGYSGFALVPILGVLEVSGRSVSLQTRDEEYQVWTGDDFDIPPRFSEHSLEIEEPVARVGGFEIK